MGIEQEIVKHLNLCAALMSDPTLLRTHPGVVADQFQAARLSIEALGCFLKPRPADQCECHAKGWMDVSIIKDGIGQMVTKLLATHLGVIRLEKFPCIVQMELKSEIADEPDNYTIREIKESNCMGAIVLLYYYLYWYLFLIRMNQRIDPMYCTDSQLNIKSLITSLPRSHAFLEFRYLGDAFRKKVSGGAPAAKMAALLTTQATYPFMFSLVVVPARPEQTRQTMLVAAYRRALDTNLPGCEAIEDTDIEFMADVQNNPSSFIFNTITTDSILRGMTLMGGMASVFERCNAIQKWRDMHQIIQVVGMKTDGTKSKMNGKMANILSSTPYCADAAEFKENATKACVYDFCSAALMMDVCRSFQKLSEVVDILSAPLDDEVHFWGFVHSFLRDLAGLKAETYALTGHIQKKIGPNLKTLEENDLLFVNKDDSALQIHEPTPQFQMGTADKKISLWLDEFRNHHPVRTPGLADDINRSVFMFDYGLKREHECMAVKWLSVVQNELIEFEYNKHKTQFCTAYALVIIASFMRNSWMVTHGSHSVKALIGKITHSPGFRNISLKMGIDYDMYSAAYPGLKVSPLHNVHLTGFMDIAEKEIMTKIASGSIAAKFKEAGEQITDIGALITESEKKSTDYPVSFTNISDYAVHQLRILTALTAAAKDFYRYPALAWEVIGKDGKPNIDSFEIVRERRRAENDSAGGVENLLGDVLVQLVRNETGANRAMLETTRLYEQLLKGRRQPPGAEYGQGGGG